MRFRRTQLEENLDLTNLKDRKISEVLEFDLRKFSTKRKI